VGSECDGRLSRQGAGCLDPARGAHCGRGAAHERLGPAGRLNRAEEITESSYRRLAQKLREDHKYAYLPSVLAEAGLLPGYAFPGDPGSLSLGVDADVVFAGRLQAQREFCPGQTVYARGHRWVVRGLALHPPWCVGHWTGSGKFAYTECPVCGLAQASNNNCRRCQAELRRQISKPGMRRLFNPGWKRWSRIAKKKRQQGSYDVRPHPQRDVGAQAWAAGDWPFGIASPGTDLVDQPWSDGITV